jgi:hypothetical protein
MNKDCVEKKWVSIVRSTAGPEGHKTEFFAEIAQF